MTVAMVGSKHTAVAEAQKMKNSTKLVQITLIVLLTINVRGAVYPEEYLRFEK